MPMYVLFVRVCPVVVLNLNSLIYGANDSVGKNEGGDTATRTEIETAGSGKDLGVSGLGLPLTWAPRSRPLQAAPYAISRPHPLTVE